MRLGAPVGGVTPLESFILRRIGLAPSYAWSTPEEWAGFVCRSGYTAAYCPLDADADDETVHAYARAAATADVVIAEVHAWSNPIDADDIRRAASVAYCQQQLDLADRVGARCCINISGSRIGTIRRPSPENLTNDTFALIVDSVREIIDAVRPYRTFYALEMMPWLYPNSPESNVELLKAIDRPQFAVHLDVANLINSPEKYFKNSDVIRACIRLLGPHIRSCHLKDVKLSDSMTVHIDEVRPGLGALDFQTLLAELDRLDPDMPVMLEHLSSDEEYAQAGAYIRQVAEASGVTVK